MEWHDDPQDRAPMTEALDIIKELQSRLAAAEAELSEARAKSSRLEARCGDLQEENERLRAALERISDWPDGAQSKIAKAALRRGAEMSFDEDKLDDPETYYNANKFKSMICRAIDCKHNQSTKPICTHEWVEIETDAKCIFYALREVDGASEVDDLLSDWQDDPQDRAPMTEAIDTIKELQQRLAAAEAELTTYRNSNKDFAKRVFEAEAERDQALSKSSRLEARCGDLQDENDQLKAENERLRKAISDLYNTTTLYQCGEYVNPEDYNRRHNQLIESRKKAEAALR